MKTEREKMLAGEFYNPYSKELAEERLRTRQIMYKFNSSNPAKVNKRKKIIQKLFGSIAGEFVIEPPFYCDYGGNIYIGRNFFANYNFVVLDVNVVTIGDNCLFGPNVQIYSATHPVETKLRLEGKELGLPVHIGNNVWLGGGTIICPGVTIGDNVTVGAGSVVTRNIPSNVVAVGNPCKVLRYLDESI